VTALGKDRPGIVAGVTKILYQLGCNLEDSAMTRLEGEFAVMLIFSAPAKMNEERLGRAFAMLEHHGLGVHLKRLSASEAKAPKRRGMVFQISVYGADRPGIVYRISEALARLKVNITDLHTHRSTGGGPSLYVLLLEVEVPASRTGASLGTQLSRIAKQLGVQVNVRQAEAAVL
jgi:glycine cleavage system transcriptional repressor